MNLQLKLYHYWRSSSSWRVRWTLHLKKLSFETISIDLLTDDSESPEHLKRNPMGYVPVLEVLQSEREPQFLAESVAIIEWLEETFPTPSVYSGDSFQRARIRQLAEIINSGTQPLQNPNVSQLHSSSPDEQKKWNQHWIRKGLLAYETLVKPTAKQFSVGDTLTLADFFLIPQCYNAFRQGLTLDEFPTIQRIYQNALQTESGLISSPDQYKPA